MPFKLGEKKNNNSSKPRPDRIKIHSMRFHMDEFKNIDMVKEYLKENNITDNIIKVNEDQKNRFIKIKFYNSKLFKKNRFIIFTDHNNIRTTKGILKTDNPKHDRQLSLDLMNYMDDIEKFLKNLDKVTDILSDKNNILVRMFGDSKIILDIVKHSKTVGEVLKFLLILID